MRELIKYAFLPTRLSNGEWIWFCFYAKVQKQADIWECVSDFGWPDTGKWDYVNKWVTIEKRLVNGIYKRK